jgi:5'-methylthioadenosine phosphorylase
MADIEHKVVILGGSGVEDSPLFNGVEWKSINTQLQVGVGDGVVPYQEQDSIIFIPRHGGVKDHPRYAPSATQYKANILAARVLGANTIIATSAVGSLNSRMRVGQVVVPHDYLDETGRSDTFFEKGVVVHASPRPAFSEDVQEILTYIVEESIGRLGFRADEIHDGGVYCTISGNRFGTESEGNKRSQYADLVGMTVCPEAALAMELGMHYAVACFVVDMDHDANHDGGTRKVMEELSQPEKVPAYITHVAQAAKVFAQTAPPLEQLKGNVIPGNPKYIENEDLRAIARELMNTYCK